MKWRKQVSFFMAGIMMAMSIAGSSVAAAPVRAEKEIRAEYQMEDLVKYINPLIGSNNFKGNSEFAGLAPFVTSPFGMTNFTPQTRQNSIGGISYLYKDTKFKGFFATHQPAIWMGDYGYVNVMPQIGDVKPDENGRALTFDYKSGPASGDNAENKEEVSTPYYYQVKAGKAEGKPITSEMTATERCAIYRFTYPENKESKIFVESARNRGDGNITVDEEKGEIYGWNNDNMSSHLNNKAPKNLKGYFVVRFSKPVTGKGTYQNYDFQESTTAQGQKSGAYLTFQTKQNEVVEIKIGTSFISVEQARKNMEQEIGNKSFDSVKEELKSVWNEKMNIIQIDGATQDEKTIFYTAMFHALLYPRTFYENVDGKEMYFSPFDDQYHEGRSYTDFSLWDTFRAQNSFMTLVVPERIDDMINSLLQTFKEGGYMPKWPNPNYTNIMIGTHADSLVAEAIKKGFTGFDYNLAYEAVFKDAMVPQQGDGTIKWQDRQSNVPYEARGGLSAYKALGYIPNQYVKENVSRSIEFAYDDWCVAQVAKAVGNDNDYRFFLNRSMNYKNMISPETGYAMGRDADGNWTTNGEEFTEGDRRKYTWFAPHDPQGLLDYMTEHKGADFYNNELQKAYGDLGGSKWIEHQNEPCHHYAYMFDFSGRPDLTQKYARQTLVESYTSDTNGELGNDDCGQMSAWYVFSAMGFYPVNPASGEYAIGSPIFDKVTIHNPGTNKDFVITAPDNDGDNFYIQSARLNGKDLNEPVISYEQISKGGNLDFVMGSEASEWAADYRKEAITFDETAESPKDDLDPPFFGDSTVNRINQRDITEGAKVSASHWGIPANAKDIGDPAVALTDKNYDFGYVSDPNIKLTNEMLAAEPYYLTMEWDQPKENASSVKIWSNYTGSQAPRKIDLEVQRENENWTGIVRDHVLDWKNESGGDNRSSAVIPFDPQSKVTGIRILVKEANLIWSKIAVRELEVFEDFPAVISISSPVDYAAQIKYMGNKLEKLLFNGRELAEGKDYSFTGQNKNIITVNKEILVSDGANASALLEFIFSQGKNYVEKLVIWDGWKANLQSLVEKAIAKTNETDRYTEKSINTLKGEIEKAQKVLEENQPDEALESASRELTLALEQLVFIQKGFERIEWENADSITPENNPDRGGAIKIESGDDGTVIANTFTGAWFLYEGVTFGEDRPATVKVRYTGSTNCYSDSKVEVRLDGPEGELLGTVNTPPTGSWSSYVETTAELDRAVGEKIKGTHSLCFVLGGTRENGKTYAGNYNWISFQKSYESELRLTIADAEKHLRDSEIGEYEGNYTEEAADILTKAIQTSKEAIAKTDGSEAELKQADEVLKGEIAKFKDSVITAADVAKKALYKAADEAQKLVDAAVIGENPGNYPKMAVDLLQEAIAAARETVEKESGYDEYKKAAQDLDYAVLKFKASVIEAPDSNQELKAAIEDAKSILEQAEGGDEAGCYPQEAIDKFHKEVQTATDVLNSPGIAQEELIEAIANLDKARETFLQSVITEEEAGKKQLQKTIQKAEKLLAYAVTGEDVGCFPDHAVRELEEAIHQAEEILSQDDAGKEQLEEMVSWLNSAIEKFKGSVITAEILEQKKLLEEIKKAEALLEGAIPGTEPGNYPQRAIDVFREAIEKAKDSAQETASKEVYIQEAKELRNAMDTFEKLCIVEVLLESIQVTAPQKVKYFVGEKADFRGLEVTAIYSDGSYKEAEGYRIEGFDTSTEGAKTIKVIFQGKKDAFSMMVTRPEVKGIRISQKPQKTEYYTGEYLNLTGLAVTADYTDGTSAGIMDYTVSGWDFSTPGTKVVSIGYGGYRAEFVVKVTEITYYITYWLSGGSNNAANPTVYSDKEVIRLKNPARRGYIFKGWYRDKNYKQAVTQAVRQNYTLYAKWEKVSVKKASISSAKRTGRTTIQVTVKKPGGIKGYDLRNSTNSKMKNSRQVWMEKNKITLKSLKSNRTYYVKARAYRLDSTGRKVYGKFSDVKKVNIK